MDKFITKTRNTNLKNVSLEKRSDPGTSNLNRELVDAGNSKTMEVQHFYVQPHSSSDSEKSNASEEIVGQSPVKREAVKKGYKRKLREEWTRTFPWLIQKRGMGYCKYCDKQIAGGYAHLTRHAKREYHIGKSKLVHATPNLDKFLKNSNETETLQIKVRKAEFMLMGLVVEHNLPFLLMEHLPKLLRNLAPDSQILKHINCSRTKATNIVKMFREESENTLQRKLRNTPFSLIIDETTDISIKKCLAVLVRYVDIEKFCVRDRLLSLVEIENCTAEGIFEKISDILHTMEIPLEHLIGFAADNAAVMMGNFNGVQAKLKELNPNIFVIGCICHSIHLCASSAANKLPTEIEDLARNIYNYLGGSCKRLAEYQEFQEFLALKPNKLLKLSQTRWLSLEAVVIRILEQWSALKLYFTSAVNEDNLVAAHIILDGLNNDIYKLYFLFLAYILPLINKINIEFQSEKPQLHKVFDRINTLYRSILKNFMRRRYVDNSLSILDVNPLMVNEYLPEHEFYLGQNTADHIENIKRSVTEQSISYFKTKCLGYYVELCLQIRKRFENLEEYRNFRILNPEIALNDSPSLTFLLRQFRHFSTDLETISSEYREIANLPIMIKNELSKLDFQSFWFELYKMKNSEHSEVFGHICRFVFKIMSLPHSSAAAERVFSQLNLIKLKTRNRLLPENCNALLMAKELIDVNCYSFEPSMDLISKKIKYD